MTVGSDPTFSDKSDSVRESYEKTPPAVHVALVVVGFIFGVNHVWAKVALENVPPFPLAAMRSGFAALVLSVVHVFTTDERVESWKDLGELALYAVFGVVVNQVLYLQGLHMTTSVNTSVLIITIPVFTTFIAVVIGQEKGTVRKWSGIVLAAGGASLLSGIEAFTLDLDFAIGNALIVINSLSYAVYLVISKRLLRKYHPVTVMKWIYLIGATAVIPIGLPDAIAHDWGRVPVSSWLAVGYVLVFTTVVVYFINLWALKRTTSSVVAIYIYLQPLIAGLLAIGLGRDRLTWTRVGAALLVFMGVYLTAIRSGSNT